MNMLSLFSGIGGIDIAAGWCGIKTSAFVEIDPFCRAVLAKHWPDVPQFGDIRDVTADTLSGLGPIDVIAGGFPCQPHSVAGKHQASSDERDLWPEFRRILREVRPVWCVAENVPGLLSSAGDFFGGILRDLAALGYDAGWGVWGACDVGAAHRRERVFIVAHRDGDRCGDRENQPQRVGGSGGEANVGPVGEAVAYRDGAGRERLEPLAGSIGTGEGEGRLLQSAGASDRQFESGMGEFAARLPPGLVRGGLYAHPQVARPGEEQFPHEPTRTAIGVKHRARQLKAYGNSVDPFQILPLLEAIVEAEGEAEA